MGIVQPKHAPKQFGARSPIAGAKGGGKGGGKSKSPKEVADQLASREIARVMEIVGEGPMGGPIEEDALKSFYFDETPARNADGTDNFSGVTLDVRLGEPDQLHVGGITSIESEVTVGVEATHESPVVREIADATLDGIRAKIRVPALQAIDSSGDLQGAIVQYAIDRQANGGSWQEIWNVTLNSKFSSPYERQYRVDLPPGGFPYLVRFRRISEDSPTQRVQKETFWASYTNLIDAKLSYPNVAYVQDTVNAEEFGGDIPARASDWRGIVVPLPTNYDPETREYATSGPGTTGGVWDLSFTPGVSDNPAWLMREVCVNKRWGAGDEIDEAAVDIVGLYEIAQFNDELVPDGRGGMEPRYTFNGVVNTRQRAYDLITSIAASCGCLCYWGPGAVIFVQDRPQDIEDVFTPANVIGGTFNYETSGDLTRPTVALVTYSDTSDGFRPRIAYAEKADKIIRHGWRPLEIAPLGCASEGQAMRIGKLALEAAWNETEMVSFSVSFQNALLAPGQIIGISDPTKVGARFGGRILGVSETELTLDAPIELEAGETYFITVILPDGKPVTKTIADGAGTWSEITVTEAFDPLPLVNAMWAVHAGTAELRPFRVLSIRETEKHIFEVTALQRDPDKWARVEQNLKLPPRDFTVLPTGLPAAPLQASLMATPYTYAVGPTSRSVVALSWSPSDDPRVQLYEIQVKGPLDPDFTRVRSINGLFYNVEDAHEGMYEFRVRGVDALRRRSPWVTFSGNVDFGRPEDVTGFRVAINEQVATLTWNPQVDFVTYKYEIRFTPLTTGATWENSQVLVQQVFATTANVPAMAGTYLIKALTQQNLECDHAQLVVAAIGPLNGYNAIVALIEQPAWTGTKVNVEAVSGRLQLVEGETIGTYTFSSGDLTAVYSSRVSALLEITGLNANVAMADWVTLASVNPLSGTSADQYSVKLEMRYTEDDPGGSPTYTDLEQLVVGDYTARAFEFVLTLESFAEGVSPAVERLEISIDMPDRTESADDVTCPAGGLAVTYAYPFLIGPAVAITPQGMSERDDWELTSKTQTGFGIRFFNWSAPSTDIERTFDWIAKGAGIQLG